MIDLVRFAGLVAFGGGLAWMVWLLLRWTDDR